MGEGISHQQTKRLANEHLIGEGSSLVASRATRDSGYGVWIIGYRDPAEPDLMLDGGGLVVTDDGDVHNLSSAPGSLDSLMMELGRSSLDAAVERKGETPALLADTDPERGRGPHSLGRRAHAVAGRAERGDEQAVL